MVSPCLPPHLGSAIMEAPATFPSVYSPKSNNNMTQYCMVYIGMVVDGILDAGKLERAHQRLVELWPPVGGTLDRSTSPWSFSNGSNVDFKARTLNKALADVNIIPFKSASSTHPTLHKLGNDTDSSFHFDNPRGVFPPDVLFGLRVTVLRDATLLGMRYVHHLFDGEACYDVARAFCDIVNDKAPLELIPPPDLSCFLSEKINGEDKYPPNVHPGHFTVGPQSGSITPGIKPLLTYFTSCLMGKLKANLGLEEKDDERMIHLPAEFVARLRARCQAELDDAAKNGELKEGAGVELVKNDIVSAWILKVRYSTSIK